MCHIFIPQQQNSAVVDMFISDHSLPLFTAMNIDANHKSRLDFLPSSSITVLLGHISPLVKCGQQTYYYVFPSNVWWQSVLYQNIYHGKVLEYICIRKNHQLTKINYQ